MVEGYLQPDSGTLWSTLTMGLPCPVPVMALDHRSVLGRPGVPLAAAHHVPAGDPAFDERYLITSPDPATAATLLTTRLRDVLIRRPVQRLTFDGPRLLVRTFDGTGATAEAVQWLDEFAAAVLAATPAFVTRVTGAALPAAQPRTFPPGLYGWGEPESDRSDGLRGGALAARFAFAGRRRE
ncbi:MAG: hypothetical protein DLM57_07980 [Pseudonocardiales bacterium]|nr:MAG: hypothetical protein DLM57_07980 [Pseudonocardiales bacterium]